jgi:hypothetical protein
MSLLTTAQSYYITMVVILGKRIPENKSRSLDCEKRALKFCELYAEGRIPVGAKIVASGSGGEAELIKKVVERQLGSKVADSLYLDVSAIDTHSNFLGSFRIADTEGWSVGRIILVTSEEHAERLQAIDLIADDISDLRDVRSRQIHDVQFETSPSKYWDDEKVTDGIKVLGEVFSYAGFVSPLLQTFYALSHRRSNIIRIECLDLFTQGLTALYERSKMYDEFMDISKSDAASKHARLVVARLNEQEEHGETYLAGLETLCRNMLAEFGDERTIQVTPFEFKNVYQAWFDRVREFYGFLNSADPDNFLS